MYKKVLVMTVVLLILFDITVYYVVGKLAYLS